MTIEIIIVWQCNVEAFCSCERVTIFLKKLHMAHAVIAPWKQNGSLKTGLRKYVEQSLTHEEVLDFVKRDYSNNKWKL